MCSPPVWTQTSCVAPSLPWSSSRSSRSTKGYMSNSTRTVCDRSRRSSQCRCAPKTTGRSRRQCAVGDLDPLSARTETDTLRMAARGRGSADTFTPSSTPAMYPCATRRGGRAVPSHWFWRRRTPSSSAIRPSVARWPPIAAAWPRHSRRHRSIRSATESGRRICLRANVASIALRSCCGSSSSSRSSNARSK